MDNSEASSIRPLPCIECILYAICKHKYEISCNKLFGWFNWTFHHEDRVKKRKQLYTYYKNPIVIKGEK